MSGGALVKESPMSLSSFRLNGNSGIVDGSNLPGSIIILNHNDNNLDHQEGHKTTYRASPR